MARELPRRQGKPPVAYRHQYQDLSSGQPALLQTFPDKLLHREKRRRLQHRQFHQGSDQGNLRYKQSPSLNTYLGYSVVKIVNSLI